MIPETLHYLPIYQGEEEPGHIPGFACLCEPVVEWDGLRAEVMHFPLLPGTDGDYYAFTDMELCNQ